MAEVHYSRMPGGKANTEDSVASEGRRERFWYGKGKNKDGIINLGSKKVFLAFAFAFSIDIF